MRALTKTFAGGRALDDVDFAIAAGEIHALLGENGSGKSTLIKVVSGFHRPDPGATVLIGGQPLAFGSPLASYELGARFVHQDLGLVEASSISDNLAFGPGFPTAFGTILARRAHARAARALEQVEIDIDPDALIGSLSPAQKTGVAVARALLAKGSASVRLLVLDEPTARLPEHEVVHLLALVRSVARRGIGVLYVTHRLDEVFEIADHATTLRDGRRVASKPVPGLTRHDLLHDLFGAALEHPLRMPSAAGQSPLIDADGAAAAMSGPVLSGALLSGAVLSVALLSVDGLCSEVLREVTFAIEAGEVVGVAGITGSGRDALCATLFGAGRRDSGVVRVNGQPLRRARPAEAMAQGVAYVPAERKLQGAFMDLTARENISISNLQKLWRWPRLRRRQEGQEARRWFDRFSIRPNGAVEQLLSTFSGGNQQKVVFGKWFQRQPVLFLLDEPTQGVDVSAKAELHAALFEAARSGAGVLISSSDVEELATTCDRVLVLRSGRIVAELRGAEVSPHAMSRAALGIDHQEPILPQGTMT